MALELVVTGDAVINDRISSCRDDRFLELVDRVRDADVSFTHLETTCHDYDEPEVYPAAVAGGTWMRAPKSTGAELSWAGFDVVSHASNHALDYAYGGLRETWSVLDTAGIAHAGTGENLAAAREPAFVDVPGARVGLVSMTSSFPAWSRAGEARRDVRGRPGVNPLRFGYEVDEATFDAVAEVGAALGYVVVEEDDAVVLTDPASRNATTRFERSADGEVRRVVRPRDRDGNLRAVEAAGASADVTIAHVHTHEFRAGGDVTRPPRFLETFSRELVEAGADVVVCQGSHAPTRGIEVHDGAPILYDPGDFVIMADAVTRQPADFYFAHEDGLDRHPHDATVAEAIRARGLIRPWESGTVFTDERRMASPEGGFFTGPGSVLATCRFDATHSVESIELQPVRWLSEPASAVGVPIAEREEAADRIVDHVADLSGAYGTRITRSDGLGHVSIP